MIMKLAILFSFNLTALSMYKHTFRILNFYLLQSISFLTSWLVFYKDYTSFSLEELCQVRFTAHK